jgi:hypothetical protein
LKYQQRQTIFFNGKKEKKNQLMTNWTTTRDTHYTTGKWHNDASNNTMKRYFWMPGDKACASHTPHASVSHAHILSSFFLIS